MRSPACAFTGFTRQAATVHHKCSPARASKSGIRFVPPAIPIFVPSVVKTSPATILSGISSNLRPLAVAGELNDLVGCLDLHEPGRTGLDVAVRVDRAELTGRIFLTRPVAADSPGDAFRLPLARRDPGTDVVRAGTARSIVHRGR